MYGGGMERALEVAFDRPSGAPGRLAFDAMAVAIVFLAYAITIFIGHDPNLLAAVLGGVANTIPVVMFGAAARWIITKRLVGRSAIDQFVGHTALCLAFSLLSFWILLILLGIMNGTSAVEFTVQPFAKGNAWQLLENATIYAVIATLSYLHAWRPVPSAHAASSIVPTSPAESHHDSVRRKEAESSRHFVRSGEDILPMDTDRIISIVGADDYADVATLDRNHLVRMTLAEFENTLDAAKFVRIHRSAIVNADRIERAESAGGGRLLLHMENGQTIQTSRAGSRLLRARII